MSQGGTEVRSRFDPGFCGEFGVASIRINRAGLGGSAIDVWLRTASRADCAAAKFAVWLWLLSLSLSLLQMYYKRAQAQDRVRRDEAQAQAQAQAEVK